MASSCSGLIGSPPQNYRADFESMDHPDSKKVNYVYLLWTSVVELDGLQIDSICSCFISIDCVKQILGKQLYCISLNYTLVSLKPQSQIIPTPSLRQFICIMIIEW